MKRRYILFGLALGAAWGWRYWQRRHPVDLDGKVVIVTGASSGIGRAAAHAFAAQGARVVLAARRADLLAAVQEEIAVYGAPVLAVPTDVTDDAQLEALVRAALEAFGRIDVLVNDAGVSYGGWHHEVTPAEVRQMVAINFTGAVRLAQMVLAVMLRQAPDAQGVRGHIVNVTSMAGRVMTPGMAAYIATRRGLDGFSAALRRETAGTGVRVSSVHPTWTRTPMAEGVDEDGLRVNGVLWPLERFDPADVPALAIVEAVRYNRRIVALGGPMVRLGWLAEVIAPRVVDLYLRVFTNVREYMTLLRGLGA